MIPSEPLAGRYSVSELVQQDQLGVVYRAADLSQGEAPRFVRVWLPSLAQDPGLRAQLRQRSARLAALAAQQPALPRLFSVEDSAEGDLLLVTDSLEARSLGDWLSANPPADARAALPLAIRVGEAVEAVHNSGLVHGHLAPGHIAVCGPDQQVRLNGFEYGALPPHLLRQLDLDAPPFSRHHLAPEQQATLEATEAGDIYAYACLLRDLLESVRPARRLPAGVDQTVRGALASNPADRPRAIGEVLNDLWGELAEEPVAGARRRAFARRVGPAVVLAALVVAGASLWVVHKSGSKATAELAARPPAVRESKPPDASPALPAPTVQEPTVLAPPPPPPPPHVTDDSQPRAGPPPRPIEPAPPRSAITEGTAGRQPVRTQVPRPGPTAPETPRRTAADPGPSGPDRPTRARVGEDEGQDPGSIIDWLLQEARTGRP